MTQLLSDIFNHDFSNITDNALFSESFFAHALTIAQLKKVCDAVCASHITIEGKTIDAAISIKGRQGGKPFAIIAQLHGNEPAGLAGILLAIALSQAGKLERDVIGVIGNPLAAKQYFAAWEKAPHARQETRDAYRCGLSDDGTLLPDMNRIPVDFLTRPPTDHHTKRVQELYAIGKQVSGVLDIHSARGSMVCITDYKHESDLRHSPIRNIMTGLAEAISAHASGSVKVQTLKTIFGTLFADELESQTGIEAGRHEAREAPYVAASFTLSLLHTLGLTTLPPLYNKENGIFKRYAVQPRLSYADLHVNTTLTTLDRVYMARSCRALASVPERSDTVIVSQSDGQYALQTVADFTAKPAGQIEFAVYQYDEMEAIARDQVVAVALPSGTVFKAPSAFSTLFISKSADLYDKDPSVGPWPVTADKIAQVKFCYPCDVSEMKIDF